MGRTNRPAPELRKSWGNWGKPTWGLCEDCGRSILLHPNGERTRCVGCQLRDLALRAKLKRRKGRLCLDCRVTLDRHCRSPRCPPCRKANLLTVKNRSARERRAWAREELFTVQLSGNQSDN